MQGRLCRELKNGPDLDTAVNGNKWQFRHWTLVVSACNFVLSLAPSIPYLPALACQLAPIDERFQAHHNDHVKASLPVGDRPGYLYDVDKPKCVCPYIASSGRHIYMADQDISSKGMHLR